MSPADMGVLEAEEKTQFVDSCNKLCRTEKCEMLNQNFGKKGNRFKLYPRYGPKKLKLTSRWK